MKKFKKKFFSVKGQDKEDTTDLDIDLVAATHLIFGVDGVKEAPHSLIQRRTSDGEVYSSKRSSSSSLSLNLERPNTVYEMRRDDTSVLSTRAGSYRRLESKEVLAASMEDLRKKSVAQEKGPSSSNSSRNGSLDRRTVDIYVEGILRKGSLESENCGGKRRDDTSDEDVDKTPTDGTPVGSSTSDLTPTGSTENMQLKRNVKKRFSRKWWKEKKKRYSIPEGESM